MLAKKVEAGEIGRRMLVVGKRLNIDSSIDNAADLVEVYDNAVGLGIDEQRHKFRKALIKVSKTRPSATGPPTHHHHSPPLATTVHTTHHSPSTQPLAAYHCDGQQDTPCRNS